jgi:GntR family transcriptional regulator
MIPFRVDLRPGASIYEQVVFAATKAIISGRMRPGEIFPSVRVLSRELKINPNTAHKVIAQMVSTGQIEVRPGVGTIVAPRHAATRAQKSSLLDENLEQLAVEGMRLGIELQDIQEALEKHWRRLEQKGGHSE